MVLENVIHLLHSSISYDLCILWFINVTSHCYFKKDRYIVEGLEVERFVLED